MADTLHLWFNLNIVLFKCNFKLNIVNIQNFKYGQDFASE